MVIAKLSCSQYCLLLGGGSYFLGSNHREDRGPFRQKLGGWRVTSRGPFLSRDYAIRGNVWSNCIGTNIHDSGVWCRMQGRNRLGDRVDDTPGSLRHVFR